MSFFRKCNWCGRSHTEPYSHFDGYCSNMCKVAAAVAGDRYKSSNSGGGKIFIILIIIAFIYMYFSEKGSEDNTPKEENISTSERNIRAEEEEEENISVSEENNLTEEEEEMERDKLIESLNNAFVDSHINAYTRWSGNSFYIEGEGVSDEEFIRTILTEFNFKKSSVKKLGIKKVIFTDIYNKTEQTIEIE